MVLLNGFPSFSNGVGFPFPRVGVWVIWLLLASLDQFAAPAAEAPKLRAENAGLRG